MLIVFVAWEAYWSFRYITAPSPDYQMIGLASLLFVLPPLLVAALAVLLVPFLRDFLNQRL